MSRGLLAALGAALLVLALSQVLKSQTAGLAEITAQRARLDPMARAVSVQWGLVHHERVAERVLAGRRTLDEERRLQAQEVSRRIAELEVELQGGWWTLAQREARALSQDWRALDDAFVARRIGAAASRQAHRLLVEQALQVMDLLSAAAAPDAGHPVEALRWAALARAALNDAALNDVSRSDADPGTTATWAAISAGLEARRATLARDAQRLALQRQLTGVALAGALLALLAMLAGRLPRRRNDAAPAAPRERRGHGRRATDRPPQLPPATLAQRELQALRDAMDTQSPSRL